MIGYKKRFARHCYLYGSLGNYRLTPLALTVCLPILPPSINHTTSSAVCARIHCAKIFCEAVVYHSFRSHSLDVLYISISLMSNIMMQDHQLTLLRQDGKLSEGLAMELNREQRVTHWAKRRTLIEAAAVQASALTPSHVPHHILDLPRVVGIGGSNATGPPAYYPQYN